MGKVLSMNRIFVYILLAVVATSLYTTPISAGGSHEFKRIAIVLVPGLSEEDVLRQFINSSTINISVSPVFKVEPEPPYVSLYYELSIVNGVFWNLSRGVPLSGNKLLLLSENKTVEAWKTVNQSIIDYAWARWKTAFIGVHGVDISSINNTVNFGYNTSHSWIPPAVFRLKINSSTYWGFVKENISLVEENKTLKLVVGNETSIVKGNETSIVTLNITGINSLEPGLYDLKFYVFPVDNESYKVVTLGTIKRDLIFSKNIIGFTKPLTPYLPKELIGNLTMKELLFIVRENIKFYQELINHVLTRTGLVQAVITYYPLVEEAKEISIKLGDKGFARNITSVVYSGVETIVKTLYSHLGKDETLVVLFSPYSLTRSENTTIAYKGSAVITPGIIKYREFLVKELVDNNITFSLTNINGKKIILVKDPRVSYNGISYGDGVLVLVNIGEENIIKVVDAYTALGYIMSISSVLGYGGVTLFNKYHDLSIEYSKLESRYNELNATVNNLKKQVSELSKELGDVKADKENLTSRIAELENELKVEKQRASSLTMFLTAGMVSIIVIAVMYGFIMRSLVKRVHSK